MSGIYFTNSRYVSRGNAFNPIEQVAKDKDNRRPQRRKVVRKKKGPSGRPRGAGPKSVKNIRGKNSNIVDARKSRGNVNAININLSGRRGEKPNPVFLPGQTQFVPIYLPQQQQPPQLPQQPPPQPQQPPPPRIAQGPQAVIPQAQVALAPLALPIVQAQLFVPFLPQAAPALPQAIAVAARAPQPAIIQPARPQPPQQPIVPPMPRPGPQIFRAPTNTVVTPQPQALPIVRNARPVDANEELIRRLQARVRGGQRRRSESIARIQAFVRGYQQRQKLPELPEYGSGVGQLGPGPGPSPQETQELAAIQIQSQVRQHQQQQVAKQARLSIIERRKAEQTNRMAIAVQRRFREQARQRQIREGIFLRSEIQSRIPKTLPGEPITPALGAYPVPFDDLLGVNARQALEPSPINALAIPFRGAVQNQTPTIGGALRGANTIPLSELFNTRVRDEGDAEFWDRYGPGGTLVRPRPSDEGGSTPSAPGTNVGFSPYAVALGSFKSPRQGSTNERKPFRPAGPVAGPAAAQPKARRRLNLGAAKDAAKSKLPRFSKRAAGLPTGQTPNSKRSQPARYRGREGP